MIALTVHGVIFFKEKSVLKDLVMGLIKFLKTKYDIQVQYLCCDNVGENIDIKQFCNQEGMGMEVEYTTTGASQQSVPYPIQCGVCHAQWWEIFFFPEKWLIG